MPSQIGRSLECVLKNLAVNDYLPLVQNIPLEPSAFYEYFGYLRHENRKASNTASTISDVNMGLHQYKRVLVVKSNKIGLSTSTLMADFQLAILPSDHGRNRVELTTFTNDNKKLKEDGLRHEVENDCRTPPPWARL